MRSDWINDDVMHNILSALTYENRLAITVSLVTGLRISDVLELKRKDIEKERVVITERKTLKRRQIRLPARLRNELLHVSGKVYVFECRTDARRHRTRQAVYKDIKRAATAFRVNLNVSCHTARKMYAVHEFRKDMNIKRVQLLLNHSNEAVTLIYAIADELTARKEMKRKKKVTNTHASSLRAKPQSELTNSTV